MQRQEVVDRIAQCIKAISLGKITSISENDRITEDLDIDSMGATDMVFRLEDEFDISITDSELIQIEKINDIVELVLQKDKVAVD